MQGMRPCQLGFATKLGGNDAYSSEGGKGGQN